MSAIPEMQARLDAHLRPGSPYHRAAQEALSALVEQKPELRAQDVDAWLKRLWPERGHHGGTVDPISARRALEAFTQRAPLVEPAKLGAPTLRLGSPGARLLASQDDTSWTAKIDRRSVPAEVAAFLADLDWFRALDLSKPDDYRAFGAWAGWRVDDKSYERGTSLEDLTMRHWLKSTLASRHDFASRRLGAALEAVLDAPAKGRDALFDLFRTAAKEQVRETAERVAVWDAFLLGAAQLMEKVELGTVKIDDARAELESKLGLPAGSIAERDFRDLTDEFSYRSLREGRRFTRDEDGADDNQKHARYVERVCGSAQHFRRSYVVDGVS